MSSDEADEGAVHPDARGGRAAAWAPWRRGLDVLDDYAGGGVLSEELADDLVNELAGLVGGARSRRSRRGPHVGARPSPSPGRSAPAPRRPRLVLLPGGAS